MSQNAVAFYLDAGRRIVRKRDIEFASRPDLLRQIEPDLERCWSIEVWQGDDCIMCAKAHGCIETRCGKPSSPAEPETGMRAN